MSFIGMALIMFGIALMSVTPVRLSAPQLTGITTALVRPMLRTRFPIAPPSPDLDELVRMADAALEADPLISATAQIARTYDQA